jgi:hypothetical protein
MTYAIRSLGITSLGLAGETLKGPAFQAMDISNWREYQDVFGGTSTEKFKGSQYPKYELPYIAKSYLSESERLKVVRVLGLSGYNAGPAWLVTASNGSGDTTHQAVAVIRSRGTYHPYDASEASGCTCETTKYDTLRYSVGEKLVSGNTECDKKGYNMNALQIREYIPLYSTGNECDGWGVSGGTGAWTVSQTNKGRFKFVGVTGAHEESKVDEIIKNKKFDEGYFEYPVSLNPYDKEYILNVLGTKAYDGDAPIFVETLYDVALEQAIANYEVSEIDSGLTEYNVYYTADFCGHEPVFGIVDKPQSSLNRKYVGRRYLADKNASGDGITCVEYDFQKGTPLSYLDVWKKGIKTEKDAVPQKPNVATASTEWVYKDTSENTKTFTTSANTVWSATTITLPSEPTNDIKGDYNIFVSSSMTSGYTAAVEKVAESTMKVGQIYTVRQYTTQDGKRHYYYTYYSKESVSAATSGQSNLDTVNYYGNLVSGGTGGNSGKTATLVLNNADGLYYKMVGNKVDYVHLDMNDYKSAYRYASTPWIVSNLKGDFDHIEMAKLFRFHTISDGDNANYEVKVSIENIRPDDGVFDVVVRRVDDLDESIIPLEKFGRCTMIPGDSNYIAYKIGSFDGVYESKSKYITVEVNETTAARTSVPAGFLGYPIPQYSGTQIGYYSDEHYDSSGNTNYSSKNSGRTVTFPSIKYNRFFDEDIKNRKQYFGLSSWVGVDIDNFTFKGTKAYINDPRFLSHGFHLDSRLETSASVTVDGEHGYEFDCVSTNSRTQVLDQPPVIGKETEMYGSIYEYVNLRKFTVFFYGGFDGWDVYRDQRTNTDSFKMSQYRGYINQGSGEGYSFNKIANPDLLGLNQNGITSDWYAYLAAIRQFANPEATDINVLATPGIDYVNQKLLVQEAIEMVEEERADSIYVVTTPDKPSGAGDYVDEMYTPDDAVYNLEETEIDSNYTCTYYPWVKYLDVDNNQYIYLPATKDVVRNFAQTDNQAYPWFAPAGVERGQVDCVRAKFITKLGDEDILYDGRINPIKTFAQDGPKIWGQKNLQINESQLNRIAVRRLLLRMRKLIAIACVGLIFEPNDATTKQSFISTVTPILDTIRSNRGISDYRIEVNDTIESRERRELPAKIYFKPYNALEYITIDFVLTPEGLSFDDI